MAAHIAILILKGAKAPKELQRSEGPRRGIGVRNQVQNPS